MSYKIVHGRLEYAVRCFGGGSVQAGRHLEGSPSPAPSLVPSSGFALLIRSTFPCSLPPSLYMTLSPVHFLRISSRALVIHYISPFLQLWLLPREISSALRAQPSAQNTSSIFTDHNVLTTMCLDESGSICAWWFAQLQHFGNRAS
jgi:hypothetical protein